MWGRLNFLLIIDWWDENKWNMTQQKLYTMYKILHYISDLLWLSVYQSHHSLALMCRVRIFKQYSFEIQRVQTGLRLFIYDHLFVFITNFPCRLKPRNQNPVPWCCNICRQRCVQTRLWTITWASCCVNARSADQSLSINLILKQQIHK